jgi:hypothetical protein
LNSLMTVPYDDDVATIEPPVFRRIEEIGRL